MNIEELKKQAETESPTLSRKNRRAEQEYRETMRRWISQNNIRLPRGAFFISALFFFNAVCIVSDNLLIIESFGEMAYNISYLTRVPGTNTLLACCCLLRPEEVNSEY